MQCLLNEKKVSRYTPSNLGLRTSGNSESVILIFGRVLALTRSLMILVLISKARLQTTQPTSGGAVTADSSYCANCVKPSPCPHRIGKAQTQFSHPLTPSPPTPPRAKHIHMSHTPPSPLTTLISSTSPVLDKTPEPPVPLIHALTATTPSQDPTPALLSPSHITHTCTTNNSTCITVTATTALTT